MQRLYGAVLSWKRYKQRDAMRDSCEATHNDEL